MVWKYGKKWGKILLIILFFRDVNLRCIIRILIKFLVLVLWSGKYGKKWVKILLIIFGFS